MSTSDQSVDNPGCSSPVPFSPLKNRNNLVTIALLHEGISDMSTVLSKADVDPDNVCVLNLHSNLISDLLNFPYLKNVVDVNLSSNEITTLNLPLTLPCMRSLDLSSNQISRVILFPEQPSLERLLLPFNSLKTLDESPWPRLPKLSLLDLRDNCFEDSSSLQHMLDKSHHPVLKTLLFQQYSAEHSTFRQRNSFCDEPDYVDIVGSSFPSLEVLDGLPVSETKEKAIQASRDKELITLSKATSTTTLTPKFDQLKSRYFKHISHDEVKGGKSDLDGTHGSKATIEVLNKIANQARIEKLENAVDALYSIVTSPEKKTMVPYDLEIDSEVQVSNPWCTSEEHKECERLRRDRGTNEGVKFMSRMDYTQSYKVQKRADGEGHSVQRAPSPQQVDYEKNAEGYPLEDENLSGNRQTDSDVFQKLQPQKAEEFILNSDLIIQNYKKFIDNPENAAVISTKENGVAENIGNISEKSIAKLSVELFDSIYVWRICCLIESIARAQERLLIKRLSLAMTHWRLMSVEKSESDKRKYLLESQSARMKEREKSEKNARDELEQKLVLKERELCDTKEEAQLWKSQSEKYKNIEKRLRDELIEQARSIDNYESDITKLRKEVKLHQDLSSDLRNSEQAWRTDRQKLEISIAKLQTEVENSRFQDNYSIQCARLEAEVSQQKKTEEVNNEEIRRARSALLSLEDRNRYLEQKVSEMAIQVSRREMEFESEKNKVIHATKMEAERHISHVQDSFKKKTFSLQRALEELAKKASDAKANARAASNGEENIRRTLADLSDVVKEQKEKLKRATHQLRCLTGEKDELISENERLLRELSEMDSARQRSLESIEMLQNSLQESQTEVLQGHERIQDFETKLIVKDKLLEDQNQALRALKEEKGNLCTQLDTEKRRFRKDRSKLEQKLQDTGSMLADLERRLIAQEGIESHLRLIAEEVKTSRVDYSLDIDEDKDQMDFESDFTNNSFQNLVVKNRELEEQVELKDKALKYVEEELAKVKELFSSKEASLKRQHYSEMANKDDMLTKAQQDLKENGAVIVTLRKEINSLNELKLKIQDKNSELNNIVKASMAEINRLDAEVKAFRTSYETAKQKVITVTQQRDSDRAMTAKKLQSMGELIQQLACQQAQSNVSFLSDI